jgi:DNA-binding response OmpR family regulator
MSRVLVIDDESIVGTVLRYALQAEGHSILVAESGREGLELALAELPDAIVLDLMMPVFTGHDVLVHLREVDAMKDVPVLVLTAVTMSREREECLSEGADLVMTKPFDPREVARAVDALMAPGEPAMAAGR